MASEPSLGPDMGETRERAIDSMSKDMKAIRKRVLGGGQPATSDSDREVYESLQELHQIDLHDEKNVAPLEDPGLVQHMEAARQRLSDYTRGLGRLPRKEDLRTQHAKSIGKLSEIVRDLDSRLMQFKELRELEFRQARIPEDLIEGKSVHGFSRLSEQVRSNQEVRGAMQLIGSGSKKIAEEGSELVEYIEKLHQSIFLLRRELESVGDGLLEILDAADNERSYYREILQLASRK